jgi:hypothetical protein
MDEGRKRCVPFSITKTEVDRREKAVKVICPSSSDRATGEMFRVFVGQLGWGEAILFQTEMCQRG